MPKEPEQQHSSKAVERFIFFSDAVFAFALTLLASKLQVPDHAKLTSDAAVLHVLAKMAPGFFAYAVGFFYVATLWVRHHRLFESLQNYDRRLITLNFILLFCVSAVPFSIDLFLAGPPIMSTLEIYLGLLGVNGLAFFAVWIYTRSKPGLLPPESRAREVMRRELIEYIAGPVIILGTFVASMFLGLQGLIWAPVVLSALYWPARKMLLKKPAVARPAA